jgi:hypothetical protein
MLSSRLRHPYILAMVGIVPHKNLI